ncbi:50S ribosomal protein L21 [Moheibacter lacus]|uniref:Large ribosomal subunit protein bL21 n=1 Tax=Moheibacter lacus TaxID=2745851 RepID=A0A838ZNJ4_9FLAO|nr:50S ribosomal protein L21 [Moheibacter lacus]MBA5629276.1 50S ribosomal protein L21 [Moheibacter lacus]
MYAIVEIAGLQYKVEQDQQLYVNRLQGDAGVEVSFDRVLLTDNGSVQVGAPVIDGVSVVAKIVEHVKGDKVIVFKKKRRKGYKKKNGHRQQFTKIEIVSIGGGKAKAAKKETKVEEKAEKAPVKKAAKKTDDLTLIEGIGPKAAETLVAAKIDTFAKLSKKSVEDIKAVLEAGENLAHLDPETWAKQAALAAEGKFDELKAWQDELDGGKTA